MKATQTSKSRSLATSAPSAKVDEETVQVGADYAARLGALEHLHLPGLTDLVRLIFNAGKLQRYPVIMIVRGGGLGDTLQATFVAESLRQWYHDAFIIMVLRNDWGLSAMVNKACVESGRRMPVNAYHCIVRNVPHKWYASTFMESIDIYVDMTYTPKVSFGPIPDDWDDDVSGRMRRHRDAVDARWKRDEWIHSLHERYPMSNNDWLKMRKNLLKWQFELIGIPYMDRIPLDVEDMTEVLGWLGVGPGGYVTFCGGAGGNSIRKEYPWDRGHVGKCDEGCWWDVLRYVREQGLIPLQIGGMHEPAIPKSVGVDLRGKTDSVNGLSKVCGFIKDAAFHIGIEGGMVHYARCVDTPSVVVHGPTGKTAFGYQDNVNVGHEHCFDCFWGTERWYQEPCPHGHETCLNFPSTSEVQHGVGEMIKRLEA